MDTSIIIKRAKFVDRVSRWVIIGGGLLIIISVIAILFLITQVTFPLFTKSKASLVVDFELPANIKSSKVIAVGVDEYLETAFTLDRTGQFTVFDLQTNQIRDRLQVTSTKDPNATIVGVERNHFTYSILWSDSTFTIEKVNVKVSFDEQDRVLTYEIQNLMAAEFDSTVTNPIHIIARLSEEGNTTQVSLLEGNQFQVTQTTIEKSLFGDGETVTTSYLLKDEIPGNISAFVLDKSGQTLYASTSNGYLLRWDLSEIDNPILLDNIQAFSDERRITTLTLLLGDISLIVGDDQGGVSAWFPVTTENQNNQKDLTKIHTLSSHDGSIRYLIPSRRHKSVASLDKKGIIHIDHTTSNNHLLTVKAEKPIRLAALSSRGDGLVGIDADQHLKLWHIKNPHPEASWKSLFGKVWYESYDKPEYVWQSSSASDDFEPKLSLIPLMFGTIKGTFYAMIFAIPLALLGAIYTSQFMQPGLRKIVKPSVEIMAAVPTVVIGFLAALWFAPIVEKAIIPIFLSFVFVPVMTIPAVLLWHQISSINLVKKVSKGYEFLIMIPFILLGIYLANVLGPLAENMFFGGDFKHWLFTELDVRYDQRNCVIIAFGLGFTVIPIIFTIADEALSNVPRSLGAASLALGASRWQTVWRIILPSASPGIFAGVMIGFGRAIGETMIVLMATGNTPIIDWSIFNGMRTLSANIAVEVPEAPVNGTLYRVLFLSAVILFLSTFILNTIAEVVRHHLRKKYGRFQ